MFAGINVSKKWMDVAVHPTGETWHVGDMRTVRLGETFVAVLIHDAISYMTTEADLMAVFGTARAHLRPDGLLIVAATTTPRRQATCRNGQPRHWPVPHGYVGTDADGGREVVGKGVVTLPFSPQ